MICTNCGCSIFNYDSFEDMYCCGDCKKFYYPEELNVQSNAKAGYLTRLGDKL